jgi:hypothetical protein
MEGTPRDRRRFAGYPIGADALLQPDRIAAPNFAALQHRGVHTSTCSYSRSCSSSVPRADFLKTADTAFPRGSSNRSSMAAGVSAFTLVAPFAPRYPIPRPFLVSVGNALAGALANLGENSASRVITKDRFDQGPGAANFSPCPFGGGRIYPILVPLLAVSDKHGRERFYNPVIIRHPSKPPSRPQFRPGRLRTERIHEFMFRHPARHPLLPHRKPGASASEADSWAAR